MNTGSIPDDQQLARQVPQQMLQEIDYLLATDGVLMHLHQQFATRRDTTDDRQMIIAAGSITTWCFPFWRIGPHGGGQQVEGRPRLQRRACAARLWLFLISGQRVSRQERWRHRCVGWPALAASARSSRDRVGCTDMIAMIGHTKNTADQLGNPRLGPDFTKKAMGLGTLFEQGQQVRTLVVGEAWRGARRQASAQGFDTIAGGARNPAADCALSHAKRLSNPCLRPAFWCSSHARNRRPSSSLVEYGRAAISVSCGSRC